LQEPLWSERVLHRRDTERHKPFPLSRQLGWPPYWLSIRRDRLLPFFVLDRVLPPSEPGAEAQQGLPWFGRVPHRRDTARHKPFPLSRQLGWPPYWLSTPRDKPLPFFVLIRVLPPSGRSAVRR
jgi:hypothetical protein